jgi:ubiquinone/menaquinone biosynthesis C-methylase UbiE
MDVQAEMLARVREKAQAAGLKNVEFLKAGLGEGKLREGYFERATLVSCKYARAGLPRLHGGWL